MTNVPWKPCTKCSSAFIPSIKYQRVCETCISKCEQCGEALDVDLQAPRRVRKCDLCRERGAPLSRLKVINPDAYARELARLRNKNTIRYRVATRFTDISASHEIQIRQSARRCAICCCKLTSERHIDHIIPIEMGGTHTRDNVRVTCPTCNLGRPRTYDDIGSFQMNLWMGTDAASDRVALYKTRKQSVDKTCVSCGAIDSVPDHRRYAGQMICFECKPKQKRPPHPMKRRVKKMSYGEKYDMELLASLREAGFGYKRIASHMGITRDVARTLVKHAVKTGLVAK